MDREDVQPIPREPLSKQIKICSVDGCQSGSVAKGYCSKHYAAVKRHGVPNAPGTPKGALKAFIARALQSDTDECIEWPFAKASGYGTVRVDGKMVGAHVMVCKKTHGTRPEGMDAAHKCGNRGCINPKHIRWKTRSENLAERDEHGTHQKGENAPWSKLTKADVDRIRSLRGHKAQSEIAREFGVTQSYVSAIQLRKVWG